MTITNREVGALTALVGPATGDLGVVVDISDTAGSASGTTKKITLADMLKIVFASFAFQGIISPTQITSNQNDYNPTSLSTASTLRLTSDASRNITGLQGGASGRVIIIENVGAQNIVLKDDDGATSTAANRFALVADITIPPDGCVILKYDSTSSRWRALAKP